MTSVKACGQQKAETIIDVRGNQLNNGQAGKNADGILHHGQHKTITGISNETLYGLLALPLHSACFKPVDSQNCEDNEHQQPGIISGGIGEGEQIDKMRSKQQPEKSCDHTCRHEKLLEKRNFSTEQLTK